MTFLKRLRLLPALLGVVATFAAIGTNLFGDFRTEKAAAPVDTERSDNGRLIDELVATKFSKMPVLTYQPRDGEMLFAWQIQPTVADQPERPRDVLILVDTSASQAGRPLQQARHIITALANNLTPNDNISVWSLSTPDATRPLTKDFQPASAENVHAAAVALTDSEYASGATDLKAGIEKALASLNPNRGRQQIVLYLGDGESAYKRVAEADRLALGNQMDAKDFYFFAVPLGIKLDSHNLHGLSVLTGGSVVRVQEDLAQPLGQKEFVTRLKTAFDVPVVKPVKWKFGDEVGESYPTKLPPLRTDRSTLVMGKMAKPLAGTVTATVNGLVNGREIALELSQPLPAPLVDHFFLNLMIHQWKNSPHSDAPAMLQSDRALALASTQVKLYRNEFLTQAVWAISVNRFDEAEKLYAAAIKVDPTEREAVQGAALVAKLKSGTLTKAELEKRAMEKTKAVEIDANGKIRAFIQDPKTAAAEPPPPAPATPPNAVDLLKEAAAQRQIEELRYKVLTDQTIRAGRALLRTDPDAAYQDLKRQRDEILAYGGIGDDARRQMVADLEAVMREVFIKGAEIKRQADTEREAIARARQKISEFDRLQDQVERDKNRVDQFRQLMKQARFELAYQEAQLMVQEKVSKGLPVPVTTTASYIIGQQATQLREWRELTRIREDRFLLAMLQTEKSHIPYPDEPPVHFPPASVWRELTGLRRDAYLNSNLGPSAGPAQKRLKSLIENEEVVFPAGQNINDVPLFEILQMLSKQFQISFIIMEEYFVADGGVSIREAKPKISATQLRGFKLGNFLELVLVSMNATFIVRPDYIEITTFQRRREEKVTQVFPVADLVIPIPSSVNQQVLQQNQNFQNQSLAIFGQASLFGGGLSNLGGGLLGGLGQGGGGGNPLNQGGAAAGPFGQAAQQQGNLSNQGIGGGIAGITGGQLGQFGNLGGQFGLQGGDQSQLLLQLILETVAKGEWANLPNVEPMPGDGEEATLVPAKELNSLGYYPPARALIVRGTSRYHSAATIKLTKAGEAAPVRANPQPGNIVIGPDTPRLNAVADAKPQIVNPKIDRLADRKKLGNNAKTMWNDAIKQTVTDPGLIVACAEFLMEFDEFGHAAEVLKGNLRKGLATDDWAYEALAIALQAGGGSPIEVERAAVSAIDLDPTSAKAYLKAAKAEAKLKNHERAIAFCKRAAEHSPNDPTAYANALAYADTGTEVKSDAVIWATDNLLKRDWNNNDSIDYHKEVHTRLPVLEGKMKAAGQKTDSIAKAIAEQNQRDLVIELRWQGNADLDMSIAEPIGAVCSPTHKRTTGGGVLKADILEQQNDRSELYTAASAFSGTYKVTVKQAFGRPIGGKATLYVTKFKGTPRESTDLIDVTLNATKPIEIKLDAGSRTTLAPVSEEINSIATLRGDVTSAPPATAVSGLCGGVGKAGSALNAPVASSNGPGFPLVNASTEAWHPGISANTGDIRASYKLNADRKSFSVTVNAVFSGKGEIAMPKVPLLPGGEK